MNIKVAIISPIYNVNKYLDDFFESFKPLGLDKYELIIIDDCGDNFDNIYKRYSGLLNLKLIRNDKNIGLSRSRNVGLKNISEDVTHVMYIDSDDKINDINFINELVFEKATFFNEVKWDTTGYYYNDLNKHFNKNTFHNKIIGRALPVDWATTYTFDESIRFYEDMWVTRRVMKEHKKNIILSKTAALAYRQRGSSISNSKMSIEKLNDFTKQMMLLHKNNLLSRSFIEHELYQRQALYSLKGSNKELLPKINLFRKLIYSFGGKCIKWLGLKYIVYGKTKNGFS